MGEGITVSGEADGSDSESDGHTDPQPPSPGRKIILAFRQGSELDWLTQEVRADQETPIDYGDAAKAASMAIAAKTEQTLASRPAA